MLKLDFKDNLKYDYITKRNCRENGGCIDGICRCSRIHNAKVINVDFQGITSKIYDSYFDNSKSSKRSTTINSVLYGIDKQIDLYTIDRILRSHKIWKNESWEINIIYGYYGQEIESININKELSQEIKQDIDNVFNIDDLTKRIEYLLNLEYGYLLPELKGCKYNLVNIDKNDIIFGSQDHLNNLEKLEYYNDLNYNNIRGIVIKNDNKWRLIDGYHRVFSTNQKSVKVLNAYVNHG